MNKNVMLLLPEFEKAKNYWLNKLAGGLEQVKMPVDFIKALGYEKGRLKFILDTGLSDKLYHISRNQDIALYTILTAALKILIYKYTSQNDILVGAPLYTESEGIYEYNKCIVLRNFIQNEMTFKEFLIRVKQSITEGYDYQYYPFDKLTELLQLEDGMSLFRVIVALENIHKADMVDEIASTFGNDITFSFLNTGAGIEGSILYNANLFKEESIRKLHECYLNILGRLLSDINVKIADIELITEEERRRITEVFNNTQDDYPREKTLHTLFREQAERTPERTAVSCVVDSEGVRICGDITYKELNEKANQLARVLREKGVKRDSIVGLLLERSVEMAVGILGILKAGGAYLPIDPEYPQDRIMFMLEDSGTNLLLTQQHLMDKAAFEGEIIDIKDEAIYNREKSNIEEINEPGDLAYVIYTSGSTGKPKGVLVEHRSVVNFAHWRVKKYSYKESDVTLQLISISFDGFGTNFYSSLLSGGSLIMVDGESWRDFSFIKSVISDRKVTNMSVVPSMYRAILQGAKSEDLRTLRFVVLAGEKSDGGLIDLSKSVNPDTVLINEYGPTENTITTTSFTGIARDKTSVIGQPVSNHRVYIINRDHNLTPIGVPGELCVSGDGLARGYLNRKDLTEEKFISNPFYPVGSQLMYRTGDLAKWLPDGNIEFLGRVDHQVKIRGFRIELGEIESALLNCENVKECAVIVGGDADGKYIRAYIVSPEKLTTLQLVEHMSKTLPDYMIPRDFVQVEKLPLTPNGKVDKKALLEMGESMDSGLEYAPPTNAMEEALVQIWKQVLGNRSIGVNDKFFNVGGDSMKAVQVSMECEKQNMGISVSDIFKYRTISKIVENTALKDSKEENLQKETATNYIESKNVKKLEVKPQNEITTYLHRALPLCAILGHKRYYPWFYEHFVQISLMVYKSGFFRMEYLETMDVYTDIFDEICMGFGALPEENGIIGFIEQRIDSGYYIIINIDEYCLPGKNKYKKQHFVHQQLVYGYDSAARKLLAISFNSEGIFTEISFDYDIFIRSYKSAKLHYKETAPWAETNAVQLLRPKEMEENPEFKINRFIEELGKYISSSGEDSSRLQALIPQEELEMICDIKYGFDIYEAILQSLEGINKNTFDYRAMHLLYEHKVCIYNRLRYIASMYKLSDTMGGLVEQYQEIVEWLNTTRLKFFDLEYTLIHGDNFNQEEIDTLIQQTIEILRTAKAKEQTLLRQIYEQLNYGFYAR